MKLSQGIERLFPRSPRRSPGWPPELPLQPSVENMVVDTLHAEAVDFMRSPAQGMIIFRGNETAHYRERIVHDRRSLRLFTVSHTEHYAVLAARLRMLAPGFDHKVRRPCEHGGERTVWDTVMHLNDDHHPELTRIRGRSWSREEIAAWLDALDVDLSVDADADPKEVMRERIRSNIQPFGPSLCQCNRCYTGRMVAHWA